MSELQKVVVAQFLNERLAGEFSYVHETNSFKYERAHFVMLVPARKAFQFGKNNIRVKSQLLVWVILTDSVKTDGIEIISSKYESEISNNVFLDICARDLAQILVEYFVSELGHGEKGTKWLSSSLSALVAGALRGFYSEAMRDEFVRRGYGRAVSRSEAKDIMLSYVLTNVADIAYDLTRVAIAQDARATDRLFYYYAIVEQLIAK